MTLADRLNQIISEQKITISPILAKLIATEFGYDADWILSGNNG